MPGTNNAKDWPVLREALWAHVREPLQQEHADAWKRFNPEGTTFRWNVLQQLAKRGAISRSDDWVTALWYTLSYSCMHFDALTTLLEETEILKQAPPPALHIDLGCGPGTAAWAVSKSLPAGAHLTTIGHDHNQHMIGLAHTLTDHVLRDNGVAEFHGGWTEFMRAVVVHANTDRKTILVTANSLFGQDSFQRNDRNRVIDLLKQVRRDLPDARILMLGTHPDHTGKKVEAVWDGVAEATNARTVHASPLAVTSWAPLLFGSYEPGDMSAWYPWRPGRQLAHILEVPPPGGTP